MHLLYQSDSYIVVQFDVPTTAEHDGQEGLRRGGFEIVDKFSRTEIYIEGALAERFQQGVEALTEGEPSEEEVDDFIAGYASMGSTPVAMH